MERKYPSVARLGRVALELGADFGHTGVGDPVEDQVSQVVLDKLEAKLGRGVVVEQVGWVNELGERAEWERVGWIV